MFTFTIQYDQPTTIKFFFFFLETNLVIWCHIEEQLGFNLWVTWMLFSFLFNFEWEHFGPRQNHGAAVNNKITASHDQFFYLLWVSLITFNSLCCHGWHIVYAIYWSIFFVYCISWNVFWFLWTLTFCTCAHYTLPGPNYDVFFFYHVDIYMGREFLWSPTPQWHLYTWIKL